MNRLEKELRKRGITFEADDMDIMRGPEYDVDRNLVAINGNYIITVTYSAVLDPELQIWNRNTFELVGGQQLYPNKQPSFEGADYFNKWSSYVEFEEFGDMTWDDIYGI